MIKKLKRLIYSPLMVVMISLTTIGYIAPALVSAKHTELVIVGFAVVIALFFYVRASFTFYKKGKNND